MDLLKNLFLYVLLEILTLVVSLPSFPLSWSDRDLRGEVCRGHMVAIPDLKVIPLLQHEVINTEKEGKE